MKNFYFLVFCSLAAFAVTSCAAVSSPGSNSLKNLKGQNILFFNPEIFPDIIEIREPTYTASYAAASEKQNQIRNLKILRVDSYIPFDSVQAKSIEEFCLNNNAALAIVPKVKYFKVGFGKYIFSNQVIISMKLYSAAGKLVTETSYDTYRKNARLLGSAENSIRIGTSGAIQNLTKNLIRAKRDAVLPAEAKY